MPVPEGAETMKSSPRQACAVSPLDCARGDPERAEGSTGVSLFDILDLFPHLLELGLGVDDDLRHAETVRLGADGIHFAVHLLQEEIELAAAYPFNRLTGTANVLVMPAFHSAAISTKMLQELGGATVIGPLLVGLDRPVQIVQLGAKDSQLVNMAALAAFNVSG